MNRSPKHRFISPFSPSSYAGPPPFQGDDSSYFECYLDNSLAAVNTSHCSTVSLNLEDVPEDELGVAYEFLIKKFADDSGHTAAKFYTNRTLVHLMTQLLEIEPGESVYDPACGSGGMLPSASSMKSTHWKGAGSRKRRRTFLVINETLLS
jgi:type I restriction-modification system DNA methylase subunit